jgi:preprotein translocase subunit YajC
MSMRAIIGIAAAALLLGTVTVATAQSIESGTVVRIDPQSRVVLLDDGRMYRVTSSTVLVINNQPVPFTALAPGQRVVIQSGEVVTLQGGQYVAVASTPVAQPSGVAQAPPVVTQTPAPAPASAVPVGVRQVIHGTVSSVDSNGEVKIKTQRDSFEIKVAPEALRTVKKGDAVTVDLTITPHGSPSASPR